MTNENKSWFYLTLWRGTPPEFTEKIDSIIKKADSIKAIVKKKDVADSEILESDSLLSDVCSWSTFDAEIIKKTEEVWSVG